MGVAHRGSKLIWGFRRKVISRVIDVKNKGSFLRREEVIKVLDRAHGQREDSNSMVGTGPLSWRGWYLQLRVFSIRFQM